MGVGTACPPGSLTGSCQGLFRVAPEAAYAGVNAPVTLASPSTWALNLLPFALKKSGRKVWPMDFTTRRATAFQRVARL